jgi:hypothetical protein
MSRYQGIKVKFKGKKGRPCQPKPKKAPRSCFRRMNHPTPPQVVQVPPAHPVALHDEH